MLLPSEDRKSALGKHQMDSRQVPHEWAWILKYDWYKTGSDAYDGITTDNWSEARFIMYHGEPVKLNKPGSPDGELGMFAHSERIREEGR